VPTEVSPGPYVDHVYLSEAPVPIYESEHYTNQRAGLSAEVLSSDPERYKNAIQEPKKVPQPQQLETDDGGIGYVPTDLLRDAKKDIGGIGISDVIPDILNAFFTKAEVPPLSGFQADI